MKVLRSVAMVFVLVVFSARAEEASWNHGDSGPERLSAWLGDVGAVLRLNADPVMRTIVCRLPYTDFSASAMVRATRIPLPRLMRAAYELQDMGLVAVDHEGEIARLRPASKRARAKMRDWAFTWCAGDDSCGKIEPPTVKKDGKDILNFKDPGGLAPFFDSNRRKYWQNPDWVLHLLELSDDTVVADLGAGTGYFTLLLARMVPNGRVIAIDDEPEMIFYLKARLEREEIDNVEIVLADANNPHVPENAGVVLMVNVLPFVDEWKQFLAHLKEQLRKGTRVVVVDWNDTENLSSDEVVKEMTAVGFRVLRHEKNILSKQYALVLTS